MDERIQVWLLDIKRAIEEVESFFENYPMDYTVFEKDYLRRSAVERKAEIMGEAMNRIFKVDPDFPIPEGKEVIKTRNRIIHAYDSVKPEFLWGLVIRHIPEHLHYQMDDSPFPDEGMTVAKIASPDLLFTHRIPVVPDM